MLKDKSKEKREDLEVSKKKYKDNSTASLLFGQSRDALVLKFAQKLK